MSTSQTNPGELRAINNDSEAIIRVGPDRREAAVARLVWTPGGDRDHPRRFLDYVQANRIPLDHFWALEGPGGLILASVLGIPSPGRSAILFASHPANRGEVRPLASVIERVWSELSRTDLDMVQVLLGPSEQLDQDAFQCAGFSVLATLSYMERPVRMPRGSASAPPAWPAGARVITYNPSMESELLAVLDESYQRTLDCPGLRGIRRTSDILEGHRCSGVFDPSLWSLLQLDGRTVGALLLNSSADGAAIELVYLGLSPTVRGRGLGRQLLRYGLQRMAMRPERSITLAVDDANAPAIHLYRAEGFRVIARRVAMIRPNNRRGEREVGAANGSIG